MRSVCLYFRVHQPYRLRTYRFFDIGENHYYYDDYSNRSTIRRNAENCFIPANEILLNSIKASGKSFKVAFSISGTALEQIERFAPEALSGFKKLAKTGNVEFIGETHAHSLASVFSSEEFSNQVKKHNKRLKSLFGHEPTTFSNTELIYSDAIGDLVSGLGFQTMITEGAKHILGWKSPNYVYCNNINPKLKLLLRNFQMSDDLTFRFGQKEWSEWPLTAEKFVDWLNSLDPKQEIVNIFIDYLTFGEFQKADTGIFGFLSALPSMVLNNTDFTFSTPSEISKNYQPVSAINSREMISWADEERDLTAWLGNEMQKEALNKIYINEPKVAGCTDNELLNDWYNLQSSDHFYYMSTKWFSGGEIHPQNNPYSSPYDAFINYMNVISDFSLRLDEYHEKSQKTKRTVKSVKTTRSKTVTTTTAKAKTKSSSLKTAVKPAKKNTKDK